MLAAEKIMRYGDALYEALTARRPTSKISQLEPESSIEDAYLIQSRLIERRIQAGERIIGKKIGLTSKAIQDALGVYQPDFGQLTSGMLFANGAEIDIGTLMQPKIEGELAFVLKRDLRGPGITALDVLRATEFVTPCFEVVDTRFEDWRIAIQDTVADNASCGLFVLGDDRADPRDVDLSLAGLVVTRNGSVEVTGLGAAVQGSPLNSVAWLANTLGALGIPFLAGEVILSGAQAPLVSISGGDTFVCDIAGVGSCTASFIEGGRA